MVFAVGRDHIDQHGAVVDRDSAHVRLEALNRYFHSVKGAGRLRSTGKMPHMWFASMPKCPNVYIVDKA